MFFLKIILTLSFRISDFINFFERQRLENLHRKNVKSSNEEKTDGKICFLFLLKIE